MSTSHEQFSGSAFGHPVLAEQLAKRIRRHFKQGECTGENSLVIGIFGEWGSGKSNLLHLVRDAMQPDSENTETPVITVAFNPWRYEKEEHLIVPLLETVQVEIVNWLQANKSLGDTIKPFFVRSAAFMKAAAASFFGSFKGRLTDPVTRSFVEFDADKFMKGVEQRLERKDEDFFADYDSVYFEFQKHLSALTAAEKPGFRLLFLIDDLDRCLPEKAVEMLESIKLFLDVEGCAFVLALDDEVVERGILHRYRDYLFQQDKKVQPQTHLPITGQEYLEKIVQLPFRLPAPTEENMRLFLRDYAQGSELGEYLNAERHDNALLELLIVCIPHVPRKLIRAVDLLNLLLDMLKACGRRSEFELLPLAKLTLLQLFAPDLYRFGRRYDFGFMARLEDWLAFAYWRDGQFLERFESRMLMDHKVEYDGRIIPLEERVTASLALTGTAKNNWSSFQKTGKRLYHCFEQVAHNRSGFDPERLVQTGSIGHVPLRKYYSFMEDVLPTQAESSPPDEWMSEEHADEASDAVPQEKEASTAARVRYLDGFIELLFSSSGANWLAAAQLDELRDKTLDATAFDAVLKAIRGGEYDELLERAEWFAAWDSIISDAQFTELVEVTDIFKYVLSQLKPDGDLELLPPVGRWLVKLSARRKGMLETRLQPFRDWAVEIVEKGQLDQKKRAKVGDLLGQVGDPRFHDESLFCLPKAFRNEPEPQLGFVEITDAYAMGRYAVTVAQYACYLAVNDVDDPKNWQEQLQYPNRPVIYVSWYDGVHYAEWLTGQLQAAQRITPAQLVRLPTEAQWQQAARGDTKQEYPWGSGCDADKANADENIGHPSVVGMYPSGASPYRVMDMAGNVWDWCLNKYDAPEVTDVDQSDNHRVLRGGSWGNDAVNVRCVVRSRALPDSRNDLLGFRVVLSC